MAQLTNGQHTCELVFKPKAELADILNICRDYQFVFCILDVGPLLNILDLCLAGIVI